MWARRKLVCNQQGYKTRISPIVFIADLERAMDKVKDGEEEISIHGISINNLRFADDIDIIAEAESTLERTVHSPHKKAMRYGLVMNADKTKMTVLCDLVSTMLYGCKRWTVTKRCESRILSFERK